MRTLRIGSVYVAYSAVSSDPKQGAKDLAVIKGQLSSVERMLVLMSLESGKEVLTGDKTRPAKFQEMGVYLFDLCLRLETFRNKVDHLAEVYRETYDLPPVRIRKDKDKCRNSYIEQLELQAKTANAKEREAIEMYLTHLRIVD